MTTFPEVRVVGRDKGRGKDQFHPQLTECSCNNQRKQRISCAKAGE